MVNTVGSQISLNSQQKDVLIGTLLGDGTIELNGRYPRLKIDHSIKQKQYVDMDDGYKRSDCNALRISTNSYSREEISLLQMVLRNNFGIDSNQHQQTGDQYVIYIPFRRSKKFCDIIRPFVIKYFSYKLI